MISSPDIENVAMTLYGIYVLSLSMPYVPMQGLAEVSHVPKESSETSPLPAEHGKHRAGWTQCNPDEANMNQQKFSQPWQPAADATDNDHEAVKQLVHEAIESSEAVSPVDPCSSTNLGSTECLQVDDSCTPSGSHLSPSKMASCVTANEDPSDVGRDPGDATHSGRGDSALLIANEASSSELKIEEVEDLTEASMKTDPLFVVVRQEAKAMRPQREQARRRRNEKAFLYDENLVDLILAEHEPLLPVRKDSPKPVKEDKVRMAVLWFLPFKVLAENAVHFRPFDYVILW